MIRVDEIWLATEPLDMRAGSGGESVRRGSPYVFPSRRSSKRPHMGKDTLNRAIAKLFGKEPGKKQQPKNKMGDIAEFTVHDLRRTCRSLLAAVGVPGHVAERCLNQKLKGIEGVYDRHDYYDERKEALGKVAKLVEPAIHEAQEASLWS